MLYKDLDKSNPNFEYVTKYIVKLTNDEIPWCNIIGIAIAITLL